MYLVRRSSGNSAVNPSSSASSSSSSSSPSSSFLLSAIGLLTGMSSSASGSSAGNSNADGLQPCHSHVLERSRHGHRKKPSMSLNISLGMSWKHGFQSIHCCDTPLHRKLITWDQFQSMMTRVVQRSNRNKLTGNASRNDISLKHDCKELSSHRNEPQPLITIPNMV